MITVKWFRTVSTSNCVWFFFFEKFYFSIGWFECNCAHYQTKSFMFYFPECQCYEHSWLIIFPPDWCDIQSNRGQPSSVLSKLNYFSVVHVCYRLWSMNQFKNKIHWNSPPTISKKTDTIQRCEYDFCFLFCTYQKHSCIKLQPKKRTLE